MQNKLSLEISSSPLKNSHISFIDIHSVNARPDPPSIPYTIDPRDTHENPSNFNRVLRRRSPFETFRLPLNENCVSDDI